jgi:HlyD family secretion protein
MRRVARVVILLVVLLAVAGVAVVWFNAQASAEDEAALTGSGTIEATTVQVSSQLPGRVAEVLVEEGDAVTAGDNLVTLDTGELEAQRDQAEARAAAAEAGVTAAEAMVRAAEANQGLTEAGASGEQAAAAAAQTDAARAQLEAARAEANAASAAVDLAESQIAALTITSPIDGVVLARAIEPGEYAAPGATLLQIGQLGELTLTVYVPEDRYGEIELGQTANVRVDSFPDQAFEAEVIEIADQAEFTPRNVQTEEGRRSTVFAVHLAIEDPDSRLKPGMPADVEF